ncbi:MAG: hypothetical protein U1G05_02425 [Kiritimatiellia bacterium]
MKPPSPSAPSESPSAWARWIAGALVLLAALQAPALRDADSSSPGDRPEWRDWRWPESAGCS